MPKHHRVHALSTTLTSTAHTYTPNAPPAAPGSQAQHNKQKEQKNAPTPHPVATYVPRRFRRLGRLRKTRGGPRVGSPTAVRGRICWLPGRDRLSAPVARLPPPRERVHHRRRLHPPSHPIRRRNALLALPLEAEKCRRRDGGEGAATDEDGGEPHPHHEVGVRALR